MKKEIKIPDIAENVETGLIAGVLVSEGDKVSEDQPLVEIETDKATTDIPSPYEGTVAEVRVSEGDEVEVHQVIMIIETEAEEDKGEEKKVEKGEEKKEEKAQEKRDEEKEDAKPSGKDSGAKEEKEADDKPGKDEKEPAGKDQTEEQPQQEKRTEAKDTPAESRDPADIPAAPSVRRMAREKGIDLAKISGSGPGGRITAGDLEKKEAPSAGKTAAQTELPDFSAWGSTSRESMSNIRRITAKNMQEAWQTIPHVTQFDEADITALEAYRKKMQDKVQKVGGKLTVTAILLRIAAYALQKFPRFNASLDMANEEIVYKHYFNIGVAVDTPRGLLVPVVRDVHRKSLTELSVELSELAEKARDKKISPDDLQGGNFTISNLGGIGGTGFTPIVYPPQVAILGVARTQQRVVQAASGTETRSIIPLSLSYDHRVIDGADGARFLRWICDVIEDPYALLQ